MIIEWKDIPFGKIFFYIKNLTKAGFVDREKEFELANKSIEQVSDLNDSASLFGYTKYPSIYSYFTPKGFKKKPQAKKQKNLSSVHKNIVDFFSSAICDFDCRIESKILNKSNNGVFSPKFIVDEYITPLTKCGEPNTILLGGKIGCGKSTLISALMHDIWSRPDMNAIAANLPIKVDLRDTLENFIDPVLQSTDKLNDDLYCTEIGKVLCKKISNCLFEVGIKVNESEPNYDDILDVCENHHINPIFILDELDTLYYSFCLATSDPQINEVKVNKIFHRFSRLVNYLLSIAERKLRNCSNHSPVVIVAGRPSTLMLIQEVRKNQANFGNSGSAIFPKSEIYIAKPDNDKVCEVILSWINYYLSLSRRSNENHEQLRTNLKEVVNLLKSNKKPDFTKNINLSVHGLRHLMKVLGKAALHDDTGALLKSYLFKPNLLRIYQYLDGCEMYSQTSEGVSNVFLVNDNFTSESENINELMPTALRSGHLQTYWLKYFLLKYICENQIKYDIGTLLSKEVLDVFCSNPNKDNRKNYFEVEIVHLIMLHATEVNHGRLLKVGGNSNGKSTKILASSRALLFNENLYWEFGYIFICIEDDWMMFPKGVAEFFMIEKKEHKSFYFATNYHLMRDIEKIEFIKYKAEKVLLFMQLLDISLKHEQKRYSISFYEINKKLGLDIDFGSYVIKNKQKVIVSILEFTESYVGEEHVTTIEKHIKSYVKSKEYKVFSWKVKLRYGFYDRYWNSLRRIDTHMKRYHKDRNIRIKNN